METWKLLASGPTGGSGAPAGAAEGPEPVIGEREKEAGNEWHTVKRMCVAFCGPTARRSQPRAQALGFCDNAPSQGRALKERRRGGESRSALCMTALPVGHAPLRPFRARTFAQEGRPAQVPRAALAKARLTPSRRWRCGRFARLNERQFLRRWLFLTECQSFQAFGCPAGVRGDEAVASAPACCRLIPAP
jgi:hypothetical protein